MHGPAILPFDASAGDRDWAEAVSAFMAALERYLQEIRRPTAHVPPPPLAGNAPIVNMAEWQAHRLAACDPLAAAAQAYVAASLKLLDRWAPDIDQLRLQMRLAANLQGLPDPLEVERHPTHAERTPLTAEDLMGMIVRSTYGITVREQGQAARRRKR